MSLKKDVTISPFLKHSNKEQFFIFCGHKDAKPHSLKAYSNLSTIYKHHRSVPSSKTIAPTKPQMKPAIKWGFDRISPSFRLISQSRTQPASAEHNPEPFCLPWSCTKAALPVVLCPFRQHRFGRDISALILSSVLPALPPPMAWEQTSAKGFACKHQHYTCPATTSCQFLNYTWKDISSEH